MLHVVSSSRSCRIRSLCGALLWKRLMQSHFSLCECLHFTRYHEISKLNSSTQEFGHKPLYHFVSTWKSAAQGWESFLLCAEATCAGQNLKLPGFVEHQLFFGECYDCAVLVHPKQLVIHGCVCCVGTLVPPFCYPLLFPRMPWEWCRVIARNVQSLCTLHYWDVSGRFDAHLFTLENLPAAQ